MSLDTAERGGVGGATDDIADAFYPLYERLFSEDSNFVADIDTKLRQARMNDTVEMYLSRSLGIGVISGVFLWLIGMIIGYILITVLQPGNITNLNLDGTALWLVRTLKVPALVFISGLFFGTIGFGMGFGALVAVPYSRAASRKREINMLLTDAVSYMYALSVGGMNQLEILEAMAEAEDTYGEVAKEFQSIVQETEYFDTDYRTAIRKQAMETPSSDLSQFLTDMLSIVDSGGNMEAFLSDKKEKHMRTAKQQQEMTLETLELFGEMYMTLSLFPLLLIIILVIMQMMGKAQIRMLYGTVYGLIPLTGLGFLVLVSTVKQDEVGDGYLRPNDASERLESVDSGLLDLGLIERFTGSYRIFERIKSREGTYETVQILRAPHIFFRDNPLYTLAITVPLALVIVVTAIATGAVPAQWDGMCAAKKSVDASTVACTSGDARLTKEGDKVVKDAGLIQRPVWGTFVYVYTPIYIILLPLAIFREWNVRSRRAITKNLSENLRKLSSANDTGQTLLESFQTVSATTSGKLATEMEEMHRKVNYGMSLKEALVEFNNKYHVPRLARNMKLISKAQEASSEITDVLTTAAEASENQDDIERERKSRTRMQVVIIIMTYITMLAVMAILKMQFLETMSEVQANTQSTSGGGGAVSAFSQGIPVDLLSLLFFHAVTMQAVLSGLISGYIRDADILSGLKYSVVLVTIALAVWAVVGA